MPKTKVTSFSAAGAVTSGAARVSSITVYQATDGASADTFLELFNTTSGAVILGTTAPDVSLIIPQKVRQGTVGVYKFVFPTQGGYRFSIALAAAVVTAFNGATGATTTAPAAIEIDWEFG